MDGYESEIARQPGGPFSKASERRLLRCVAEHWVNGRRYSEERRRRLATYAGWIVLGAPALVAGIKIIEAFFAKG